MIRLRACLWLVSAAHKRLALRWEKAAFCVYFFAEILGLYHRVVPAQALDLLFNKFTVGLYFHGYLICSKYKRAPESVFLLQLLGESELSG